VVLQALDKLLGDIRAILEAGTYTGLKDVKMGYKDKLVNIMKQHMFDMFYKGKKGVHDEFRLNKELVFNTGARDYLIAKAEASVSDILGRMKSTAVFVALDGVKSRKSVLQILEDIKGPALEAPVPGEKR